MYEPHTIQSQTDSKAHEYSWPVNKTSLNCAGPLILRFFSISTYYTIHSWLRLHLRIQRANCKVIWGFFDCGGQHANPLVAPGSAVILLFPSQSSCALTLEITARGWGDSNLTIIPSSHPVVYHPPRGLSWREDDTGTLRVVSAFGPFPAWPRCSGKTFTMWFSSMFSL